MEANNFLAKESNDPQVYVGTYAKYNDGDLSGAWVSLTKCGNYETFLQVCGALHKNEKDPEFMIQDHDNLPDGLGCDEWLSEKDFLDIVNYKEDQEEEENQEEARPALNLIDYSDRCIVVTGETKPLKETLKSLGGRFDFRLSCGPGWVFSKKQLPELQKLVNGAPVSANTAAKPAAVNNAAAKDKEEFTKFKEEFCLKSGNPDYYRKDTEAVLKLSDGTYLSFVKERIETSFCFGYSDDSTGKDYQDANNAVDRARTNEKLFTDRNRSSLINKIEGIEKGYRIYIGISYDKIQAYYNIFSNDRYQPNKDQRPATPEERILIIRVLKFQLVNFDKRLQTYLKRYGLSKVKAWSYWQDA